MTAALGAVLGALRPRLHRYAARMTGSLHDGEDLVQEALLRALAAPGPLVAPEAWLFRTVHNLAIDLIRRRARRREVGDAALAAVAAPEPPEGARASLGELMRLTPGQRAAVVLKDVFGHSNAEIAGITSQSLAAVKAQLHRGRARLRESGRAPQRAPPDRGDIARLEAWVSRFNARDFDALRDLLAADVRLEVVGEDLAQGEATGRYFGNYSRLSGWRLASALIDGRPAALVHSDDGSAEYPVVLTWRSGRVTAIRDFRYARYALDDAEVLPL